MEEDQKISVKGFFLGFASVEEGYYCKECGFASKDKKECREHGKMEKCKLFSGNFMSQENGVITILVPDRKIIPDNEEFLQYLRGKKDREAISILNAKIPLLMPIIVDAGIVIPSKRLDITDSGKTLVLFLNNEEGMWLNPDGRIEVISVSRDEILDTWNNLKEKFCEDVLYILKSEGGYYIPSILSPDRFFLTKAYIDKRFEGFGYRLYIKKLVKAGNKVVPVRYYLKRNFIDPEVFNDLGVDFDGSIYAVVNKKYYPLGYSSRVWEDIF
ncbi:MAG: hypothetical protein GXN95_01650 [Methanococci archaeon]|nr:hypothetical protein [Methanococci archaeon]